MRQAGQQPFWKAIQETQASQLLEFAVALPLLVVFVVGIFDFGSAFNEKQTLSNMARNAARFASQIPPDDLTSAAVPLSVKSIRDQVSADLIAARLSDCGLSTQPGVSSGTMAWTFAASGGSCGGTLTLTVERGYAFPATIAGIANAVDIISSRVTISYPYQWRFNRVVQLIAPGATYAGVTLITTSAVVPNAE